jgi:hypothetical protein
MGDERRMRQLCPDEFEDDAKEDSNKDAKEDSNKDGS